jgi:hypothetical protein
MTNLKFNLQKYINRSVLLSEYNLFLFMKFETCNQTYFMYLDVGGESKFIF